MSKDDRSGSRNALIGAAAVVLAAIITGVLGLIATRHGSDAPTTSPATTSSLISASNGSTPSTLETTNSAESAHPNRPHYLTDLDYGLGNEYVQAGDVLIGGKRYKKSFIFRMCIPGDVTVTIPQGVTTIGGVIGIADESYEKTALDPIGDPLGFTLEATTDVPSDNAQWTRVASIILRMRGARSFSEEVPDGTQAIRVSPISYSCGLTIAMGNPIVK